MKKDEKNNQIPNVLVVDDIWVNRILLQEIMKELHFDYMLAENGKKALELLEQHSFDVVLMDIEMPVMNGIEATRYIRTQLTPPVSNMPVVAITAHNPALFFEDYHDVGFDAILTKPYSVENIQELILDFC